MIFAALDKEEREYMETDANSVITPILPTSKRPILRTRTRG